jgi:hypothetical protein
MQRAPEEIGGARTVLFTKIDSRHRHTGNTAHIVAGEQMLPVAGLAICQYERDTGFYLFGCDDHWNSITDTWHASLDDAKAQAEFEYTGADATWQTQD